MKSINKKIILVSLILIISCSLPIVYEYKLNKEGFLPDSKYMPECCPSTYTTSNGCLCYLNNEREIINSRGGNKSCGGSI